jgi:hypothetical protein
MSQVVICGVSEPVNISSALRISNLIISVVFGTKNKDCTSVYSGNGQWKIPTKANG